MKKVDEIRASLTGGEYNEQLAYLYACGEDKAQSYANRYIEVMDGFEEIFGKADELKLFSAPGRTEIGGNHTDHQHGCVLAGSVNLDVIAAARPNGTDIIRIKSKGYNMDEVDVNDLSIKEEQFDKAISLIRGVTKKFVDMGYEVKGFDAYTISNVLKGSGLSSSAAFEVLIGTMINGLFAGGEVNPVEIAKFGQYAENVYYNKPSGLLDQMSSSVGSTVAIDFKDNDKPVIKKAEFDLAKHGHALCIIDSGADHADLTDEYASIPAEMKQVAGFFGKEYLRDVDEAEFMEKIPQIREAISNDRAVLRAFHFFHENRRAQQEARLLEEDDFEGFLALIKESGHSSYMYLQNVYASCMPKAQAVSLTLALCDEFLGERGAYRVHGGGFAGTVQAFVPFDMLEEFKAKIEAVLGEGMCHVLSIRPIGGYELKL
ncbi:MAG: galactokinase family protein [Clostridiales bacterium]|nr:galactokinase family protein [Clostridiales bacterium]